MHSTQRRLCPQDRDTTYHCIQCCFHTPQIWTVVFNSPIGPIEYYITLKSTVALGPVLTLKGLEERGPAGPGLPRPAKKGGPRASGPGLARPWPRPCPLHPEKPPFSWTAWIPSPPATPPCYWNIKNQFSILMTLCLDVALLNLRALSYIFYLTITHCSWIYYIWFRNIVVLSV